MATGRPLLATTFSTASTEPGTLRFCRLTGTEEISRLYALEVDVASTDPAVDPGALLGRSGTVSIDAGPDAQGGGGRVRLRHLDGIVTRFGMCDGPGRRQAQALCLRPAAGGGAPPAWFAYRLLLRPWLWLATGRGDGAVRVFEDLSVPDIVTRVLGPYGHPVSLGRLSRAHPRRPCTVQYQETDFDFIARLCEDAGIHWFFEHGVGGHRLVFADDACASHRPLPGGHVLHFAGPGAQATDLPPRQRVTNWSMSREIPPSPGPRAPARADALLTRRDIAPGHTIELRGHPLAEQNRRYLVTAVDYHVEEGHRDGVEAADRDGRSALTRFAMEAHPTSAPYRPEASAPRPRVLGPQRGVVVARRDGFREGAGLPQGGRGVRVRLPGAAGGYLTGWIPVVACGDGRCPALAALAAASPGRGQSGGAGDAVCCLPQCGWEVLVDFLQGDPEQPVVTACLRRAAEAVPRAAEPLH